MFIERKRSDNFRQSGNSLSGPGAGTLQCLMTEEAFVRKQLAIGGEAEELDPNAVFVSQLLKSFHEMPEESVEALGRMMRDEEAVTEARLDEMLAESVAVQSSGATIPERPLTARQKFTATVHGRLRLLYEIEKQVYVWNSKNSLSENPAEEALLREVLLDVQDELSYWVSAMIEYGLPMWTPEEHAVYVLTDEGEEDAEDIQSLWGDVRKRVKVEGDPAFANKVNVWLFQMMRTAEGRFLLSSLACSDALKAKKRRLRIGKQKRGQTVSFPESESDELLANYSGKDSVLVVRPISGTSFSWFRSGNSVVLGMPDTDMLGLVAKSSGGDSFYPDFFHMANATKDIVGRHDSSKLSASGRTRLLLDSENALRTDYGLPLRTGDVLPARAMPDVPRIVVSDEDAPVMVERVVPARLRSDALNYDHGEYPDLPTLVFSPDKEGGSSLEEPPLPAKAGFWERRRKVRLEKLVGDLRELKEKLPPESEMDELLEKLDISLLSQLNLLRKGRGGMEMAWRGLELADHADELLHQNTGLEIFGVVGGALSSVFGGIMLLAHIGQDIKAFLVDRESISKREVVARMLGRLREMGEVGQTILRTGNNALKLSHVTVAVLDTALPIIGLVLATIEVAKRAILLSGHVRNFIAMRRREKRLRDDFTLHPAFKAVAETDKAIDSHFLFRLAKREAFEEYMRGSGAGLNTDNLESGFRRFRELGVVNELRVINRERIARECVYLTTNAMRVAGNITLIAGVTAHVGAGIKLGALGAEVGVAAVRFGVQKARNHGLGDSDMSEKALKSRRKEMIREIFGMIRIFDGDSEEQAEIISSYLKASGVSISSLLNARSGEARVKLLHRELKDRFWT
ncbi:hypothetical protein FUAX_25120 [Fulvitalea axinellae]|uniref:Uncharacterized protein n=1 Tax=Fulvitalea axinellae TaxID=1182444 RepID=A0AAU9DCE0_9BACT|nr:hypothetical protein FUAX_25120 [Fulvitalea axinellae]